LHGGPGSEKRLFQCIAVYHSDNNHRNSNEVQKLGKKFSIA